MANKCLILLGQFPHLCNETISLVWEGIVCHVLRVDLAHFVGYLLSWDLGLQQCFPPERSEENKGATCGVHQRQILGAQMRGQEFSMEERSLCHDLI